MTHPELDAVKIAVSAFYNKTRASELNEGLDKLGRMLIQARQWRHCDIHGDIDGATQWGCPDCVQALRKALIVYFTAATGQASHSLETYAEAQAIAVRAMERLQKTTT